MFQRAPALLEGDGERRIDLGRQLNERDRRRLHRNDWSNAAAQQGMARDIHANRSTPHMRSAGRTNLGCI